MASGSKVIEGSFSKNNQNVGLYLFYDYTQDLENNRTYFTFYLKVKKLTSYAKTTGYNVPYTITIWDSDERFTREGTINLNLKSVSIGSYVTIGTYKASWGHHNNGCLTEAVKVNATLDLSNFNPGMGNVPDTHLDVEPISVGSKLILDKSDYILGKSITGKINSKIFYNSPYSHKIVCKLDDNYTLSKDIEAGVTEFDIDTSSTLNSDNSWDKSKKFSNSVSAKCDIVLYTYYNGKLVTGGEYNTTCTLSLPTVLDDTDEIKTTYIQNYYIYNFYQPSIIPDTYKIFLKNKTQCLLSGRINIGAGSTISNIKIVGSDGYINNNAKFDFIDDTRVYFSDTTSILSTDGEIRYNLYITDTRGVTIKSSVSIVINVIEYTLPKFKSVLTTRAKKENEDENVYIDSDEGDCIKSVIDFTYFTYDENNMMKTLVISFNKKVNEEELEYQKIFNFVDNTLIDQSDSSIVYEGVKNNDSYYYTVYWDNVDLSLDESYSIKYELTDSYNTVEYTDTLSTAYFIMDVANYGKSIAFGKSADDGEDSFGFEVAMPVKFTFNSNKYEINNTGFYLNGQKLKLINENYNLTDTASEVILNSESFYHTYRRALSSLKILLNSSALENSNAFNKINFSTASDKFEFSLYPAEKFYCIGTDCIDGIFTPSVSSFYSIEFEYALNKVLGKVFGISSSSSSTPDSGSSEGESGGGESTGGIEIIPPTTTDDDNPEPFPYVNQLINIAMGYYNQAKNDYRFEYGSSGKTVLSYSVSFSNTQSSNYIKNSTDTKRRYCDCSTFVGLVLRGIPYSTSRYYSWGSYNSEFRPIGYEWSLDFRDTLTVSSSNGGVRTAADIGEFFEKRGWLLDSKLWNSNDFSKLKKGDIIFWDRDSEDNGRWNNVSHIGICMGVGIDEDEWTAKGYSTTDNTDVTILECTTGPAYDGQKYGIRFIKLKDSYPTKITHIGRIQYKPYKTAVVYNSSGNNVNVRTGPNSGQYSSGEYAGQDIYEVLGTLSPGTTVEIIDENNDGRTSKWYKIKYETTSGTYAGRKSGWIAGSKLTSIKNITDSSTSSSSEEYVNCINETGSINGNNYIYKLANCKITGYGGDGSSACNIPLNFAKTCGGFNLPYGTKIYIPSLDGKKFTDGNGKSVTSDGVFTVNDTGVGCTDFDLYMSTKSDTDAESVFGSTLREDVYILSYGSGYGTAWSYTQSFEWASNNGTLSAYKSAFKDYIKYDGTLINFLKYKTDDKNIRNTTYWTTLTS